MIQEIAFVLVLLAIIVVLVIGIVTLVIVAKLYRMHDVRNAEGEYAWMIPHGWTDLQRKISESQERIVELAVESSENNSKSSKLLESLTNAVVALHEAIKVDGQGDGKQS